MAGFQVCMNNQINFGENDTTLRETTENGRVRTDMGVRKDAAGPPHVYSASGSLGSKTSPLCIAHIYLLCLERTQDGNAGYYHREVADTKVRCMHGVSTVSRKILIPRALKDRGCANGSSTAAERGMPDQVHHFLQARARGLNRSKRCPSSSSMNCGDRTTGMIPQGGAIMSCVSWGERHTKGREAQRSWSARTEGR